jgi:hypothetical protein
MGDAHAYVILPLPGHFCYINIIKLIGDKIKLDAAVLGITLKKAFDFPVLAV